jgi:O-antigen/teichoic acid export membrane protein
MIFYPERKLRSFLLDEHFCEILTGSVWIFFAKIITTALGFAFSVIVVRFYSVEVFGIVTIITSFLMIIAHISVLGTPIFILRIIPEHMVRYSPTSAYKIYHKTRFLVIGISVFTAVVIFLCANFIALKIFSKPHLSYYFAIASFFIVFRSLMLLNIEVMRGLSLVRMFSFLQILPQSFNLLFLLVFGFLSSKINVPVYSVICGYAMTSLIGWIVIENAFYKIIRPNDEISEKSISSILSISLPMLMTSIMAYIIEHTGVIMLGILRTNIEIGYYAIAVKLSSIVSFILIAISAMAGPKFSELYQYDKIDELFLVAKKSSKIIFWITTPLLLSFIVFGLPIIKIVFGEEYVVIYPALLILVIGQFISSASGATGLFMNMTGNHKVFSNIMILAAIINIGLNAFLVPYYGINGAAIAAMVCIAFWNITILIFIKTKYSKSIGYFPIFTF